MKRLSDGPYLKAHWRLPRLLSHSQKSQRPVRLQIVSYQQFYPMCFALSGGFFFGGNE
jgi:hypothetical protein